MKVKSRANASAKATLGIDEMVAETIADSLGGRGVSDEELDKIYSNVISDALPKISKLLVGALKRSSKQMLKARRKEYAGFLIRNERRWRSAFDLLETIWVISEELGSTFNDENRAEASRLQDHRFEALTFLHARSLLVAQEVTCLLRGGFPDGALSRWRTLHELVVIAAFIRREGEDIAHRYLASQFFNSYRAAKQLAEFSDRAKIKPFSSGEMEAMRLQCEAFESRFGKDMRKDYGWAAPSLGLGINFNEIEKAVGLDHWRPRYRWASQHTHGPHRPTHAFLGMVETKRPLLLVGPSNSGMVDPIQMTAISLLIVTTSLLSTNPSFPTLVGMQILDHLVGEVGPLAIKTEKATLKRHRAQKKKNAARRRAR